MVIVASTTPIVSDFADLLPIEVNRCGETVCLFAHVGMNLDVLEFDVHVSPWFMVHGAKLVDVAFNPTWKGGPMFQLPGTIMTRYGQRVLEARPTSRQCPARSFDLRTVF